MAKEFLSHKDIPDRQMFKKITKLICDYFKTYKSSKSWQSKFLAKSINHFYINGRKQKRKEDNISVYSCSCLAENIYSQNQYKIYLINEYVLSLIPIYSIHLTCKNQVFLVS